MFEYILAELPVGSRRRIRTTGNRVILADIPLARAHVDLFKAGVRYPVIIPLPPVIFGRR